MGATTVRAKSWKAAGQCVEPPYGYAAAMLRFHERTMDRRGEKRSAVRRQHCLPRRRLRPKEGSGALPEGGTGG